MRLEMRVNCWRCAVEGFNRFPEESRIETHDRRAADPLIAAVSMLPDACGGRIDRAPLQEKGAEKFCGQFVFGC